MTSLTQPADYSVDELKEALEDIDDVDELESLLETERNGQDRVTATDAIERRIEGIGGGDEDAEVVSDPPDDETESDDPPEETVDEGADAIEDEDEPVEGVWSTDTSKNGNAVHGVSDRSAEETDAAEPDGSDQTQDGDELPPRSRKRLPFVRDDDRGNGRIEARIRQLQSEVGDLKAYTNALEEFLDEEGTGRQVIESVRADIVTLEDDIAGLTDEVQVHERDLDKFWGIIGDVENELSSLDERLDRHRRSLDDVATSVETVGRDLQEHTETADDRYTKQTSRFETVEETLGDHADTIDELDDEIDAVADDVEELETEVDDRFADHSDDRAELARRIEDNADAIDDLSATVDELADEVDELSQRVGDSGPVDQRFETVEEEIRVLQEWRQQLSSVIMGSVGGDQNPAEQ